ncbi:MAG: PQQ-dependent sugar dehydrogenase [Verrucomicrobia bacterium]|nr:PQQ-dependent sugar dehydrogenase [Verrucomicrobiota bacterium]
MDFAFLPGSTRLFVAEQGGRIWSFDTRSNGSQPELVIDLKKHHQPFENILGFTFHPGFATNRFILINYNEPGGRPDGAYVSRFTVSSLNPPTIDPASERPMIRWLSGGHNGCTLAFGPDGFLYISTGDGDDPDPPDGKRKTGQDISDLLSSILRIDADRSDGTNAYSIPQDNPFRTTPGARPEVWAFGLRNPWRMSFAPDGALWVGDVGWDQWEMIYRVKRGGNYGWSITEGPNTRVRTDERQGPGPILPPMIAHPHSEAASITGGRFYRGTRLPKLRGAYIYGDWETGKFWALRNQGDKLESVEELCDTTLQPVSFTEDATGELLILDYHGGLYALTPNTAPPANVAFPRRLSETGVFSDAAKLTPAPGVVAYRPAAEMWSDYAGAERLVAVPGTNVIVTADGRQTIAGKMWDWPSNTVFTRTLTLEQERGKPVSARRIETQLLHFEGQAWNAYTFRWNKEQTDAELVPAEGTNDVFAMTDPGAPGGRREIRWRFLGRAECLRCHQCWAGDTLSFNWLQLGDDRRKQVQASAIENATESVATELERLAHLGILRVKDPPPSSEQRFLVDPYAASQPLDQRARSWLHINCSGCHRFNGGGAVPMFLHYDKPPGEWRALDEKPTRGDSGLIGARIIAPGDPFRSVLVYRISTEGAGHMPHIGSRLVDERGMRLVGDWIRSLPATNTEAVTVKLDTDIDAALKQNDTAQLLATMNGALALANSLTVDSNIRVPRAAFDHTNALVRDLFQRFLPPDQRRQVLGAAINPQTILALRGDATHGQELFAGAAQCSRCHVCRGVGRAFGPELTELSRKYDRAQTLDQVLHPSKVIAPEFKTTMVTLRNGTELTGFVLKRTADELVLRDESLTDHMIRLADVKESRESALSMMPEGLLASLTAQEAADLLAFLVQGGLRETTAK